MRLTRDKARRAMNAVGPKRLTSTHIIRVVKLKPSTPEWPIRVKLKTVDSRSTKYTALSYAHETGIDDNDQTNSSNEYLAQSSSPAETPRTILCDGNPIQVTKALWEVLDQLRQLNSDVPIWIDRLCINFDNREERAAQVNAMSYIYSNASHVIVWLGKKNKTTDNTLLCMRKLVNAIDWRKIPRDFSADFRDPATYAWWGMDRISVQQWNNIYIFCHAPWFSRLWAFHELASARQAMFLIGCSFMDYDFLMDFAMVLGLTGWLQGLSQMATYGYDMESIGLTKMLGPVGTLRSIPYWHPSNPEYPTWMQNEYGLTTEEQRAWKFFEILLTNCERFECYDARDRIFAPLSYVKKVFAGKAVNKTWPIVDYGTSVETIYVHFANMVQKHTFEPSILAGFGYQQAQRPATRPVRERGRPEQRRPLD